MQAPLEKPRIFTVDDANRMLPLVRRIVGDIVSVSERLDEYQFGLDALGFEPMVLGRDRADDNERDRIQREMDAAEDQMDEYVAELAELGLELQDAAIGEVDFPTQVEGEGAFFCWRLGEPEVAYWHWEDAGFESRQSLLEEAATDRRSPPESAES